MKSLTGKPANDNRPLPTISDAAKAAIKARVEKMAQR